MAWAEAVYIGEPEYDDSAGMYAIPIAMRINDPENGRALGVLKAVLDIGKMQALADEEAATLVEGQVLIFNLEDGYRISDTATEHDATLILSEEGNLLAEDYAPARLAQDLQPGADNYLLLAREDGGDMMIGFARTSGSAFYSAYGSFSGFPWGVIVSQPEEVVVRAINELVSVQTQMEEQLADIMVLFAGIGLAAGIGGIVLATWQTRIVVNPVMQLQRTPQELSRGDLSVRA